MTTQAPTRLSDWIAHLSLRRIVSSNSFIPEVDGFRFLAILLVVIAHIYIQCGPPASSGMVTRFATQTVGDGKHGVYLFFTISGFILALPFARHHLQQGKAVNLRSYFKRRITRLEPPYVLIMLLRAPALLFAKQTALSAVLIHLLASLFYVHNIAFGKYSTINPPAWSLEIEVQFYILAPLLTDIFIIRSTLLRRILLLAVILASGIMATLFIDPTGRVSLTLLNYFQYFAAGFLLCDLYLTRTHFSFPPLAWDLLGLAALGWILLNHGHWYNVLLPFAAILLYMAGFFGRIVRGFFSLPAISIVGGMCYSLYLTHTAVLTAAHSFLLKAHIASLANTLQIAIIFTVCGLGVLAVGTAYFIFIERPCMNPVWPQQLAARFSRKTAS